MRRTEAEFVANPFEFVQRYRKDSKRHTDNRRRAKRREDALEVEEKRCGQ